MRVLIVHNRYVQRGGEEEVAEAEAALLRNHGVEVRQFTTCNSDRGTPLELLRRGWTASWSERSYEALRDIARDFRPNIAHVHNFWMQLSPSVHEACRSCGVATVQTLHNVRLLCVNACFFRNGQACQDCLGKLPWRGVARSCYRGSLLASAAVAKMIVENRWRKTWDRNVDAFVALTQHAWHTFTEGGFPADRIFVKPNFTDDPGNVPAPSTSNTAIYVGRLAKEKGISTLLAAFARAGLRESGRLLIVGDGPDRAAFEQEAIRLNLLPPLVRFVGWQSREEVRRMVLSSRLLVLPSQFYEGFPMTIAEAFSCGRPVVATAVGGVAEIVGPEQGLIVPPGNDRELSRAVEGLLADDATVDRLGAGARRKYLASYTPEGNYHQLMSIYHFAIAHRNRV